MGDEVDTVDVFRVRVVVHVLVAGPHDLERSVVLL